MPAFMLTSVINAPIEVVFDLSRSIDLHLLGAAHAREQAIAGRTSGLIELGEEVTWKTIHFGLPVTLTTRVKRLERPYYFESELVKGPFRSLRHEHRFRVISETHTEMKEVVEYRLPMGMMGGAAERMFLGRYLKRFLSCRNNALLEYAETDQWMQLLEQPARPQRHFSVHSLQ